MTQSSEESVGWGRLDSFRVPLSFLTGPLLPMPAFSVLGLSWLAHLKKM